MPFNKLKFFMNIALKEAQKAYKNNDVPVGSVVAYNEVIVAKSYNKTNKSFLKHAEILAIKQALVKLKVRYLNKCQLYTTLEPCPMCFHAAHLVKIKTIYFGAFTNECRIGNYSNNLEIYGGILEEECAQLLKDFFKNKRL